MKTGKIVKRLGLLLALVLVLVVGALLALPYFFKDDIVAAVKNAANDNLRARVDFSDVGLSLLRDFPNLCLELKEFSIVGVDEFEGVPLAWVGKLQVVVNLRSALNADQPLEIRKVLLEEPYLNVLVLPDGRANYDIALPSEDTSSANVQIALQEYRIHKGNLRYEDQTLPFLLELEDLEHRGRGDFTLDVFELQTQTRAAALTLAYDGIAYLNRAVLDWNAGLNINLPEMKFTLTDNDLRLNQLQLDLDGFIALPNETDTELDLSFNAPSNDFKDLLSIIPNAYIEGYEDVRAEGSFALSGFVKGVYSAQPERYPAFKIQLAVNDARVQYPDLPLPIRGIRAEALVNSPNDNLDFLTVDLSSFRLQLGDNPFEGRLSIRTPLSDPQVAGRIQGRLDFGQLAQAFPLPGVEQLAGRLDADLTLDARQSALDRAQYDKVKMDGTLRLSDFEYRAAGTPPVKIPTLRAAFSPQFVALEEMKTQLGRSDLQASGRLDNLLAYLRPDQTLRGSFTLRSQFFDANEWMSTEKAPEPEPAPETPAPTSAEAPFDRFDFALDAAFGKIVYDTYVIEDLVARGRFTPNALDLETLRFRLDDSDLAVQGQLRNAWDYLFHGATLAGDIQVRSRFFDLNPFMTESAPAEGETPAPTEPILVPENVNIGLQGQFDRLHYTDLDLEDVRGQLRIADRAVKIENLSARALGGTMQLTGGYDTRNPEAPKFDLGYVMERIDFSQAFQKLVTVQKLAPIARYIEGNFNARFSMNSELGQDLMPNWQTLLAEGFIHTTNGRIRGFKPLGLIADKLNVADLKEIPLKDSKNWFEVKNGAVELMPFDYTYQDIALNIGGKHFVTGEMDYTILAKIPREKIGRNPVGAAANTGLEFLSQEASKLGLNLEAGEFVNV
ncbi:MAG: AsmA family protein, partial [Bacteroidetes bacterium]